MTRKATSRWTSKESILIENSLVAPGDEGATLLDEKMEVLIGVSADSGPMARPARTRAGLPLLVARDRYGRKMVRVAAVSFSTRALSCLSAVPIGSPVVGCLTFGFDQYGRRLGCAAVGYAMIVRQFPPILLR